MSLVPAKPILSVDFGTTNSAACWVEGGEITTIPLENGRPTIPSAIFFSGEDLSVKFGNEAIAQYEAGFDGRLMKALKTVLSSKLIDESTAIRGGYIKYREVIRLFMAHIKQVAEAHAGKSVEQALLGRPVQFVDADEEQDRRSEDALRDIANSIGLKQVCFQYEPIAAAVDYEVGLAEDRIVLIVDIGGGTSDFSLIELGPSQRVRPDRSTSVIGTAGMRLAGTDFDRLTSLATAMRTLGMGAAGRSGRQLPTYLYDKLSTWHEINTAYNPSDISDTRQLRSEFADLHMHDRLMRTLEEKLGHKIIASVELAKMRVAEGGTTNIQLDFVEPALMYELSEFALREALGTSIQRILATAERLVKDAGVSRDEVSALYFTGGSTGVRALREAFGLAFPNSEAYVGERFISVSQGLAISAQRGYWITH